ncbi:MAG TPA: hypothetical protein DD640_01505, partial [Clostridiales bacterium]|nr:hypothetical protein [Clostridiales bacterium]
MRKHLSLILVLVLLFCLPLAAPITAAQSFDLPQASSQDNLLALQPVTNFAYDFISPSPAWQKLVAGIAPASFSQVEYQLAEDVLEITGSDTVTQNIASEGQILAGSSLQKQQPMAIVTAGGYLSRDVLDAAAAQQGR